MFDLLGYVGAVLTRGLIPVGGPGYAEYPLMITTRENAVANKLSIYVSFLLHIGLDQGI